MNNQEPLPLDRRNDGALDVHAIFPTIQAEGPFAGEAALFVRLTGCNLQCPMCDTRYTGEGQVHTDLYEHLLAVYGRHELIVITGGEPFRQNIVPFVHLLLQHGHTVQVETNGVLYPGSVLWWNHDRLVVVCSPKTGKIHPMTASLAHAYKYVLSHDNVAEDGLPIAALGHPLGNYPHVARPPDDWSGPIYLQAVDTKDEAENLLNLKAVAASVMQHRRYIMGIQMNKLIGLP